MTSVRLARAVRGDAADLIQANIESRAMHEPWAKPFMNMDGFDRWFESASNESEVALVARTEDGEIVGVLRFSQIFLKDFRSAYLSYYGAIRTSGQRLMTQALVQTLAFARNEIGLHRIEANIQPDNARSIALVRRAGFQREGFSPRYLRINGEWRDHERWAVLLDALPR
ncbi:GNAT family N-acetyltransferase [Sphingobium nicotianae]|uniref:GNAT family N-acetyltransferase n=1 Tax=Sphingobium nicotianae TaxID=2782607 RepID=A0A9X1DAS1_9SPHN|nr:GNAT family N-acetyltransferase [Sphingobium nicotianae]MBT2186587.1 GNAT family N-acetyltransferase [Sphingobium nicotianae]